MSRNSKSRRVARRKKRRAIQRHGEDHVPRNRRTLSEKKLGGRLPVLPQDAVLDNPHVRHFDDTRLDTGISVKQVVAEAERWWTQHGQKVVRENRMSRVIPVRGGKTKRGGFSLDPDSDNFWPSGLLHAKPWDDLSRDEKLRVVKAYHEIRYKQPMREAETSIILPH